MALISPPLSTLKQVGVWMIVNIQSLLFASMYLIIIIYRKLFLIRENKCLEIIRITMEVLLEASSLSLFLSLSLSLSLSFSLCLSHSLSLSFSISQAYCFLMSCLLYREPNTSISALECLHQLLLSATPPLTVWFTTQQLKTQVRIIYMYHLYMYTYTHTYMHTHSIILGGCGLLGR